MATFAWPDYYNRPAFFTLQPVQATQERQIGMWIELIASYVRHHQISTIYVEKDAGSSPLFVNSTLDRRFPVEGVRTVLDAMVGRGLAKWMDEEKMVCSVSWKPFEEWASIIYKWALDNGKTKGVMTVYEIRAGSATRGEDFHGVDAGTLVTALGFLADQGKARLIPGDNVDEQGVKFYND